MRFNVRRQSIITTVSYAIKALFDSLREETNDETVNMELLDAVKYIVDVTNNEAIQLVERNLFQFIEEFIVFEKTVVGIQINEHGLKFLRAVKRTDPDRSRELTKVKCTDDLNARKYQIVKDQYLEYIRLCSAVKTLVMNSKSLKYVYDAEVNGIHYLIGTSINTLGYSGAINLDYFKNISKILQVNWNAHVKQEELKTPKT